MVVYLESTQHSLRVVNDSYRQMEVVLKGLHDALTLLRIRVPNQSTIEPKKLTNEWARLAWKPGRRPTLYLRRPLSTKMQCRRSPMTLWTRVAATAESTPPDRAQMT
eukprot:scaffold246875_cov50-Prasinocladus_malaysianus.AAC.2